MENRKKECFRNEWKYLISTSEKELLKLRMKHFLKLDPHAGTGSYMIRSLYFDDYWNSAFEEKEAGVLMRKNTVSGSMIVANGRSDWNGRKNSEALFTKKVPLLQKKKSGKSWMETMDFC